MRSFNVKKVVHTVAISLHITWHIRMFFE